MEELELGPAVQIPSEVLHPLLFN